MKGKYHTRITTTKWKSKKPDVAMKGGKPLERTIFLCPSVGVGEAVNNFMPPKTTYHTEASIRMIENNQQHNARQRDD